MRMPANRCNRCCFPLAGRFGTKMKQTTTSKNPRFQAFKYFFRLFFKYIREACFSVFSLLLTRSLARCFDDLLCVRPGLIRGNVCLNRPKKHFNDTRISSLFTIIRAMDKSEGERWRESVAHGKIVRQLPSVYAAIDGFIGDVVHNVD
jgi:hypothetical protein